MAKVIVKVPEAEDRRFPSWAKVVRRVIPSRHGGYAFEGKWLRRGQLNEVDEGAVILLYEEVGSRKYHDPYARVMIVKEGKLVPAKDDRGALEAEGRDWALQLRDRIAALLPPEEPRPYGDVRSEELAEELARRPDGAEVYLKALMAALRDGDQDAMAAAKHILESMPNLQAALREARKAAGELQWPLGILE